MTVVESLAKLWGTLWCHYSTLYTATRRLNVRCLILHESVVLSDSPTSACFFVVHRR
jgi:hypothetical protein